ncbi:MAG: RlmE family RNA methyltransferase [Deltaproteobacteria bacterium]
MAYKPNDAYYKRAKQEGYRSRAAYKLIELQQRFHLIKAGDLVVDLGAAPGGWLQVGANYVGATGKVIGVDLQAIEPFRARPITLLQGDITDSGIQQQIKEILGGPADCILSDLAPRLSGIRDADTARCLELNQTALKVATQLLRPGGTLLVKSFVNQELQAFTSELKRYFSSVQRTRPEATRQASSEVYFCATGFRSRSS